MAKILLSMIVSNDLGPISRLMPIAEELTRRGHEIAFCNRAAAPAQVIEEAGHKNFPVIPSRSPAIFPKTASAEIWNGNQGASLMGFLDVSYVRAISGDFVAMMQDYQPDVVVDTWGLEACLAARILRLPLISITQADNHPDADGYIWWRPTPTDLPNPVPMVNEVLAENGLPLLKEKIEELFIGDEVLIVGTPDTDPLPESSQVTYIGNLQRKAAAATLPEWFSDFPAEQPLIWVYSGNPRYGKSPSFADSIVVIRAAVETLAAEAVQVVLTTGHQPLPEEFSELPDNFRHAPFIPGAALAQRCDLFIHHGGHGSYLTGLTAGTPALIIPTYSERESNARRLARLGAGEFVLPTTAADGEKIVDLAEFREKARRMLQDEQYKENAARVAKSIGQYTGSLMAADIIETYI